MIERYNLAYERINEIYEEQIGMMEYQPYFKVVTEFLLTILDAYEGGEFNPLSSVNKDIKELKFLNDKLYGEIVGSEYDKSFLNPDYAVKNLPDKDIAILLCALFAEIRACIGFVYDNNLEALLIRLELFLEVYGTFVAAAEEKLTNEELYKALKEEFYYYVSDYSDIETDRRIKMQTCDSDSLAVKIIKNADLSDIRYLYAYGEYVTDNEEKTAIYLNGLPEETIDKMSSAFTGGYIQGFKAAGKDLSKKKYVNIRYRLGFERVIKKAVEQFEEIGLKPVIYRAPADIYARSGVNKVGYYGALANPQYEEDHKEDMALVLDGHLVTRRIECLKASYEELKEEALLMAGPACMETFGEVPFEPAECANAIRYSESQRPELLNYRSQAGVITNTYIKREERSFTIIAFPVPAIGKDFEAIFDEVIVINTLDVTEYRDMQQLIINCLDKGKYVHIVGNNGNKTDLCVSLAELKDPEHETIFENCVADVNIPAGEVFTSPKLAGTDGILHVSRVFLNDLEYNDLEITFKNGVVCDYNCAKGKEVIEENLLFHHKTLPLGEFAIGTNTYAYAMCRKFDIADRMPILIAEKMGPHFAIGDTCYSNEEEVRVYNPDGKEIIARENDYSLLRKTDISKAYFNCHTDITIPYDELGLIEVISENGEKTAIIQNGQFCLKGCEKLNEPLK